MCQTRARKAHSVYHIQCWESSHCVPGSVLREHPLCVHPTGSPCGVLGPALHDCPMHAKFCAM